MQEVEVIEQEPNDLYEESSYHIEDVLSDIIGGTYESRPNILDWLD